MKRTTFLAINLLVFASFSYAQKWENGTSLGIDPIVLDSPENVLPSKNNKQISSKNVYFFEGFETVTESGALPEGWVQKRTTTHNEEPVTDAETPKWFRNSASYGFTAWETYVYSGVASMAIGYTAPDFTWAISPEISIPETDGDVKLTYWTWINNALPSGFTEPVLTNYFVKIKSEGEWYTLLSYFGIDGTNNYFAEQIALNLNPFKGKSVQIAFVYEYFGWQMAIDDIFVGQELEDDFGLTGFNAYPYFALLPESQVDVSADVFCGGTNSGTVDVSLLVNGALDQTYTTGVLEKGGESEFVTISWTAPEPGNYKLELALPNDQFTANNNDFVDVYVNNYFNIAQDFENFEFDELGIPTLVWPPVGWSVSDINWVDATTQWPIFDAISAMVSARGGEDANASGETALYTDAVVKTSQDKWMQFYISGVNNNVYLDPAAYPTAIPQGQQGYSTLQLKYSESIEGPWTDLSDPIEFLTNDPTLVNVDITSLVDGTYYFAFTTTSTFVLTIGETIYRSFVMVDNVIIREETEGTSVRPISSVALKMYPNPVQNIVNIEANSQIISVYIYNVLGNLVFKRNLNSTTESLNLSKLSSGTYLIRVITNNGEEVKKLQISK